MTAFLLVVAGLTAGNGPADWARTTPVAVSFEGSWEGTIADPHGVAHRITWDNRTARMSMAGLAFPGAYRFSARRAGVLKVVWGGDTLDGLYKMKGDRVHLCIAERPGRRPASFGPGEGIFLLTLRRIPSAR